MYMFLMRDISFKENIKQCSSKEDCNVKNETWKLKINKYDRISRKP